MDFLYQAAVAWKELIDRILDRKITQQQIEKAYKYDDMIRPRLQAIMLLKESLDQEFSLYTYSPETYPFYTSIKADYLFVSHSRAVNYVFVIHGHSGDDRFSCCSIFQQGQQDYSIYQRLRTILKKERIHLPSNTTYVLYDRLSG